MHSSNEEKRKAFEALMRTAQGATIRAIRNDLGELLMTAESKDLKPLSPPTKRSSLRNKAKELELESM